MSKLKKYLILGSGGQLGRQFVSELAARGFVFSAPAEHESDITRIPMIRALLDKVKPDVVINCAAYNNVEKAETEFDRVREVNATAVKNIALLCKEFGVFLVQYSSDYVFDGKKGDMYSEDDVPCPCNNYGRSKLECEQAVLKTSRDALVLRTSWLYGPGKQNFLYKLSGWADQNRILRVSADEVSIPTWVGDVVDVTLLAVEHGLRGLYHLTSGGYASRYEVAKYFIKHKGLKNLVIPVPTSYFPSPAQRPLFSCLSNRKISDELQISIPHWHEGVKEYLRQVKHNG